MSSPVKQPGVIICKAAVAWAAGKELVMEEVEVSPPHPHEIRVKVVCTSLCRSDISAWESQGDFVTPYSPSLEDYLISDSVYQNV